MKATPRVILVEEELPFWQRTARFFSSTTMIVADTVLALIIGLVLLRYFNPPKDSAPEKVPAPAVDKYRPEATPAPKREKQQGAEPQPPSYNPPPKHERVKKLYAGWERRVEERTGWRKG